MQPLTLSVLPETLAVCRLGPEDAVPPWADAGAFRAVTRTASELSIVCRDASVPAAITANRGWRAIAVDGMLDFALTGVLASLASPLAAAGVSIFAVSTYDTDYVLVKQDELDRPIASLGAAGVPSNGPIGVTSAVKIGAGQQIDLPLTAPAPNRASAPLPADAVSAVLNITVDQDADAKSFITGWPTREPRPFISANNAEPGLVTPNLTFAKLGANGSVSFYNSAGATNLAVDLVGYTVPLANAADAAGINRSTEQSFGQGVAPVNLGATEAPVATFTATQDGTYVLDGSTSITKTATLGAGVNPDLACTWRVGPDAAGPTFRQTLVASLLAGAEMMTFLAPPSM